MAKHSFIQLLVFIILVITSSGLQGQELLTASLNTPGGAGILAENCGGPYELVLRRGADNDTSTFISISGTGTAIIGVDYQFPPGSFPAEMAEEDSILIIPITVINDGLNEGLESVHLQIAFLAGLESDVITLETSIVDEYEVEIHSTEDTIIWCRDIPFVLLASSDAEIFWTPAEFFDDSQGSAATVRPFESGWYYANVGDEMCGAKDSVYFDLAIVEILNPDTVFICLDGMGADLNGNLEGLAMDFIWIPSDTTLSNPDILDPTATPTVTTTYILQSDIGVCTASDRVVVRVDSLPEDMHIAIAPEKPYYCAGEVVALFSPSYDTLSFPDITFQWGPDNGTFDSPLTLLNAALILLDTTLYIRQNINNACVSTDSILINVVPPSVPLSVNDTTLCVGEMFTVEVLSDQVMDPQWTPSEGLSCDDCLDPKVTVIGTPGTTMFYQFSGKINECPVGATLAVRVGEVNQFSGPAFQACLGGTVTVSTGDPTVFDLQWSVFSGNLSLSCNDCEFPVVTVNGTQNTLRFIGETTDPNFCGVSGTVSVTTFLEDPSAIFIDPPITDPIPQGTQVTATLNIIPPPSSVRWIINGNQLSETGISVSFNASEEINTVEAEFTNSKGCEQIDTISIVTIPPGFMIPNAFTPNNDALNDNFKIIITGDIHIEEFLIFNRWGQLVYEAPDGDLTGWNGQFKNEPAASDTYVYKARLIFPDGRAEIAKGDVILLR